MVTVECPWYVDFECVVRYLPGVGADKEQRGRENSITNQEPRNGQGDVGGERTM